MNHRILITGASGFIGRYLVHSLLSDGYEVITTSRHEESYPHHYVKDLAKDNLDDFMGNECSTLIHLAARAHIINEIDANPVEQFYLHNVTASLNVAKKAYEHGVQRFIFISTIGVMGNRTEIDEPFIESSEVAPHSDYAASKWEAEKVLLEYCHSVGMALLILRLPLVCHIDAPANFGALVRVVKKEYPLPFAHMNNHRSVLSVCHFSSFIKKAIEKKHWESTLYLLANDESYSTETLVSEIGGALNIKVKLFYLPTWLIQFMLTVLGKRKYYEQLWGSLEVDSCKAQKEFLWEPTSNLRETLIR